MIDISRITKIEYKGEVIKIDKFATSYLLPYYSLTKSNKYFGLFDFANKICSIDEGLEFYEVKDLRVTIKTK